MSISTQKMGTSPIAEQSQTPEILTSLIVLAVLLGVLWLAVWYALATPWTPW